MNLICEPCDRGHEGGMKMIACVASPSSVGQESRAVVASPVFHHARTHACSERGFFLPRGQAPAAAMPPCVWRWHTGRALAPTTRVPALEKVSLSISPSVGQSPVSLCICMHTSIAINYLCFNKKNCRKTII
jgi:hypothetical protein